MPRPIGSSTTPTATSWNCPGSSSITPIPTSPTELQPVSYHTSIVTDDEVATLVAQGGHTPEHVHAQIAMGDQLIARSKEIQALGAFDRDDRSTAMDMLGFAKQLVFATHSVKPVFHPSDDNRARGSATARPGPTTGPCGEFCADDDRLMGVGVVPLHDIEAAIVELDWALDAGLAAIWVPHGLVGARSPATSTSTPSGPAWPRAARPSCCTSVARRSSSTPAGPTPADRRPVTGWAAARTCAARTSR